VTLNEVDELFDYNDWANARLLGACSSLSQANWSQDVGGSYPTLLSVLAHVVGGEWIWLKRWTGESPISVPGWFKDPTPSSLEDALQQVQEERRRFLDTLTERDLDREVPYTLLDGSTGALALSTLLRHLVSHSTYHRGQLASMLRRLNVAPPATDLLIFALQRKTNANAEHQRVRMPEE
jgi:uncharacterized damage-inducible protein DinB